MDIKEELQEVKEESLGILNVYKEIIADNKRASKRSFIINISLLVMLFVTNMGWILYESQWNYEYTSVDGGNDMTTYVENSESGDIIWEE